VFSILLDAFSAKPLPVDPATSIEFPTTLRIPFKDALPEFTLIGIGVRTVSFLKIKVYSAAFYADLSNPNLKVTVPLRGWPIDSPHIEPRYRHRRVRKRK